MKVLLNSFHLNGHTLGFQPQSLEDLKVFNRSIVIAHVSTGGCSVHSGESFYPVALCVQ